MAAMRSIAGFALANLLVGLVPLAHVHQHVYCAGEFARSIQ